MNEPSSPPILFENEQWTVTAEGMQAKEYHGDVGDYFIDGDRLEEDDWIVHMCKKGWVNPRLFLDAYYAALELILGQKTERDTYALMRDVHSEYLTEVLASNEGWPTTLRMMTGTEMSNLYNDRKLGLAEDNKVYTRVWVAKAHSKGMYVISDGTVTKS